MPIRTEPPDLAVAACCDHFGCECAIERRMPFGGNFRFDACKIVEACQHFLVSAVRTAIGTPRPIHDLCSPFVTKRAPPPECLMAAGHHLRRREVSVFCWVPFGGDGGEQRGKVVIACLRHIVCADRTARAHSDARFRGSLPFVTVGAEPPNLFVVAVADFLRREIAIFCWMPLGSKRRMGRSKIIEAGQDSPVRADRAAAPGGAGGDRRLPAMPLFTAPPDFAAVSGHYHLRRQIKVFFPIPLRTQRRVRRG